MDLALLAPLDPPAHPVPLVEPEHRATLEEEVMPEIKENRDKLANVDHPAKRVPMARMVMMAEMAIKEPGDPQAHLATVGCLVCQECLAPRGIEDTVADLDVWVYQANQAKEGNKDPLVSLDPLDCLEHVEALVLEEGMALLESREVVVLMALPVLLDLLETWGQLDRLDSLVHLVARVSEEALDQVEHVATRVLAARTVLQDVLGNPGVKDHQA